MPFDANDPDTKAALKEAINEATEGLIAKRDELLGEVKKLRKGQQIDPAEVEKIEAARDAAIAERDAAVKAAAKAAKDAQAATDALKASDAREQRLLVDNGLNEALAKAGVTNPILAKAAKALLQGQAAIVAEGDNRIVQIGGKPLGEAIATWAGSDEGKHFVAAPNGAGGGSQGGDKGGGAAAKSVTRAAWDGMSQPDRMAHSKAGGVVTD